MGEGKYYGLLNKVGKALYRRRPRALRYVFFSGTADASHLGRMKQMGYDVVEMKVEDLDRIAEFRKKEVIAQLRGAFDDGHRGVLVMKDGVIAAYWFLAAPRERPAVVRHVVVYPGEMAVILGFVRPEFRTSRIAPVMMREMKGIASGIPGVTKFITWQIPANSLSERALKRYGFDLGGRVAIFEFFGRPILRVTRGSDVKR